MTEKQIKIFPHLQKQQQMWTFKKSVHFLINVKI